MLGLLLIFSFWLALSIIIVVPLILAFTVGGFIAEKLELDGFCYFVFMSLSYLFILFILLMI